MAVDVASVGAIQARVEALAGEVNGVVGVFAEDLASGATVALNADMVFPTASVMKVPILYELYQQVEAGKVDLGRRIPFTPEKMVPGSGILQDLDFGLQPTVKDLATLMITVSDNAATDMVIEQVGLDAVNATMQRAGMARSMLPMTVRGILYDTVGLDIDNPEHSYDLYQQRTKENYIDWNCRAYGDEDNNLTTPREMAGMLADIERRATLSAASCDAIIDILKRQKFNDRIPALLPPDATVAHKTGSLRGIRNDAGIVYAPDAPYTISLFAKRLADPVAGVAALARISKAIWEGFVGPIAVPTRYGP